MQCHEALTRRAKINSLMQWLACSWADTSVAVAHEHLELWVLGKILESKRVVITTFSFESLA